MFKTNDRIRDNRGNLGTVTFADDREFLVKWDNGMTGSFQQKYARANGLEIVK